MVLQSSHLQQAFSDFSDLFAEAEKHNVNIDAQAVPQILGAVAYYAVSPTHLKPDLKARESAMRAWQDVLENKRGQMIMQADIGDWIRRWFPDPPQAEQIALHIKDWTEKLG